MRKIKIFVPENPKSLNLKMQSKEDPQSSTAQQQTLRHRLLPLFILNAPAHNLSFSILEVILDIFNYLQLMKFPVDYSSHIWTGEYTLIFSYIDPAYFIGSMSPSSKESFIIAAIAIMNVYTLSLILLFLLGVQYSTWMAGIRKMLFLVYRHILLLPLFRTIIGLFSACDEASVFSLCVPNISIINKGLFIISFLVLLGLLGCQSYFNFEFLPKNKSYVRLKKSSHTPLTFYLYFILAELIVIVLQDLAELAVLNGMTILLIVFVIWKDEQVEEKAKLIEFACLAVVMSGFLIVDAMQISQCQIQLYVYLVLCAAIASGILQLKTYSIRFQLQNINKWPTQDIMIRQESTIRYYLSRGNEYLFKVWIHGYMQIHRQKCDSISCPSRCILSDRDRKVLSECDYPNINQQLVRINNIMKVIFTAGYKLTPIPAQIQLEYCRYAYERSQYEIALRRLLVIDYMELTFDKYYEYKYLKEMLSTLIKNSLAEEFLDFVTEMILKREEEQIMKKFQKAAFLNLQFWSILNDDHPDFQKINEVATARIQIAKAITKQFKSITAYAHSQKITTLYSNYLECLQNDDLMQHDIYQNLTREFQLQNRILVRDWANSSTNIILASVEEITYGKIMEINASCAALFGYEKHELLNQNISQFIPEDFRKHFSDILQSSTNEETFLLLHKNSYLIAVSKNAKHYNSMSTGATALITFQLVLTPYSCQLMIDKNNKIIAQSSSLISVLGLDLKAFEGESYSYQFFNKNLIELQENQKYMAKDFIKSDFLVENCYKESSFEIRVYDQFDCKIVDIKNAIGSDEKQMLMTKTKNNQINKNGFQFQVEATSNEFRYIGKQDNEESFISQFSQSQYRNKQVTEEHKVNYAANISTLRLKDNAIQYIEENQESASQMFIKHEESSAANLVALPRKDEEEIFESKQSYQKFLLKNKIGKSVYVILTIALIVVFGLYILTQVIQQGEVTKAQSYSSEAMYQNMIISHIAQQARYIEDLYLISQNKSGVDPPYIIDAFQHNFLHLQEITLEGSQPYAITVTVSDTTTTYLTSQYISTLINYGNALLNLLLPVKTNNELASVLSSVDSYTLNYLLSANQTKYFMKDTFEKRALEMKSDINNGLLVQKALISVGFISVLAVGIVLFFVLQNLSLQKVKVFEIFLNISEIQIQHFSSKTESFLISLHSQEPNTDAEQEIDHKKHSSSFAKKKSFKLIKTNLFLYLKLSIVLIIMTIFFIHSYIVSTSEIAFQAASIDAVSMTASIMYEVSNTKEALLINQLYGVNIDFLATAQNLREKYRVYFHSQESSFGTINAYDNIFQFVLRGDICIGYQSIYGYLNIPDSCELVDYNENGTLLILTHLLDHVHNWNPVQFLQEDNHVFFEVLFEAQDILCDFIVKFQKDIMASARSNLLFALLMWMGISALAALVIWGREIGVYLQELNEIRSILGILPLTMVKESPQALKYVKEILQHDN